jgi:formylglycine-generating enzyme required for sulfatase activity
MGQDTSLSKFPIIEISWYEVILFCNKKSKMVGKDTCYTYSEIIFRQTPPFTIEYIKNLAFNFSQNGYRLPTEDEWEYAYRSGIKTDYYWGKNYYNKNNPAIIEYPVTSSDTLEINTYAWWWHNNVTNQIKEGAQLRPNAWCLYDIAGNVEEMVWNTFANRPIFNRFDYIGPDATKESFRITRGGCYYSFAEYLTAFSRSKTPPSISSHLEIGFRTVCTGTARY